MLPNPHNTTKSNFPLRGTWTSLKKFTIYTGVTLYRPFKNAKCRKCTRALEAANVAQLVQEAQSGRRSIHLQLAKGPSWRGTAPECSLLVCIAKHLAVQACFRL